jgi:hypothetical protein
VAKFDFIRTKKSFMELQEKSNSSSCGTMIAESPQGLRLEDQKGCLHRSDSRYLYQWRTGGFHAVKD